MLDIPKTCAEREGEVDGDGLADGGGDAGAGEVLEAGRGDVEPVGAGDELGEGVVAGGRGDGLLADVGGEVGEDDGGVRDRGSRGAGDAADDRGGDLGVGGECREQGDGTGGGEVVLGEHAENSCGATGDRWA